MALIFTTFISDFGQQQVWPGRAQQQVQQVVPQVAKYGGGGAHQVLQHGDHYRLQQQRQPVYQPGGAAWSNYRQNEIQDFYRQRQAGQALRDF